MKWLAFKKATKKAWIWTKTHWYLPILFLSFIVALLIWAISRNGAAMAALFDVWESSRASYDEQLSVLEGTHEEEIKERLKKEWISVDIIPQKWYDLSKEKGIFLFSNIKHHIV